MDDTGAPKSDGDASSPKPKHRAVFKYERLEVYKLARKLKKRFYAVAKVCPSRERFNNADQLRRSSLSVILNIVEGSMRLSGRDQARFTEVAHGSLHEAFACVIEAEDEGYVPEGTADDFREDIATLGRMLNALYDAQAKQKRFK